MCDLQWPVDDNVHLNIAIKEVNKNDREIKQETNNR